MTLRLLGRGAVAAVAACLLAGPALAQGPAGDAKRGSQKVAMCQGCHGIEGWRTAFPEVYHVPRIAGQHPTYFANALRAYKSGERNHPSMRSIAASLTDQDMADLAAYFAELPPRPGRLALVGRPDAGDAHAGAAKAKEVCASCHGMDGNSAQPDYPKLGGQHADFLAKALRDYKSGQRKNAIMQGFAAGLSRQDIDNLAAYYASQPRVVASK